MKKPTVTQHEFLEIDKAPRRLQKIKNTFIGTLRTQRLFQSHQACQHLKSREKASYPPGNGMFNKGLFYKNGNGPTIDMKPLLQAMLKQQHVPQARCCPAVSTSPQPCRKLKKGQKMADQQHAFTSGQGLFK